MLVGARTPRHAAARLRDALTAASVDITDIGKPCTDDTSTYPNGLFPSSALCPLWGAAGAAGTRRRGRVQRPEQGVCLADRRATVRHRLLPVAGRADLGEGVAREVRSDPETSRHGLGRALDLCGGVQDWLLPTGG